MASKLTVILQLICVAYLMSVAHCSVHEYIDATFSSLSDAFFVPAGSEGLYASSAIPHTSGSFIRFVNVSFARPIESAEKQSRLKNQTGLIETIIFEVNDIDRIGGAYLNSSAICCTPQLSAEGYCNFGEVIIQKNLDKPGWPQRIQTFFEGNNHEAEMGDVSVKIPSMGLYYAYFMFCEPQLNGTIVRGSTVWMNLQGYLPGKMASLVRLFETASVAYAILGLAWFIGLYCFWRHTTKLQYYIAIVIVIGTCEMGLCCADYWYIGATGSRSVGITTLAATLTATKKTLSRLLILAVSMGYGVVRPTLGNETWSVLFLGLMCFISMEAHELVLHLGVINDYSGMNTVYLMIPVASIDVRFIIWIFSSLMGIVNEHEIRRNRIKLQLYVKICMYFVVYVLFSFLLTGYQLYFNMVDQSVWQYSWVSPSFWTVLEFLFLVVICVLWAPSYNPTRYSYLEEVTGDGLDEEAINLQVTGSE